MRPWNDSSRATNSLFPVNCLASRIAPSIASAPLLPKKETRRSREGMIDASASAKSAVGRLW